MKKRILTVDDSKSMREMVGFTLRQAGFDVVAADDGSTAIEILQNEQFDCIITDLNMPVMDGLKLVTALRANPTYRATPILILTTEADHLQKQTGLHAGANGWLIKPFNPEMLVQSVRNAVLCYD